MAENELIQTIADNLPISGEDEIATATRVLAVVRSHDAARLSAEVMTLEHLGGTWVTAEDYQAALARIAALEAERDNLRSALTDFVEMGEGYGWGEALTGRQILMANARAALTPSDTQKGQTDA